MTMATMAQDWPADIHAAFGAARITQLGYVPDAGHKRLIELCQSDPAIRTVPLTTEEEGIGLAAGAWLGGTRAALLMQSSGIGNCINMLSLAETCRFPVLILVTMRGEYGEFNPWQVPMSRATQPSLELMGATVHRAAAPAEIGAHVAAAARLAFASYRTVAVLLAQQLVGVKTFQK